MKSGILPNKVFYIYSDELASKNPDKNFDVVNLNDEVCIWFYSNNVINNIEKDPINTAYEMYSALAYHLKYQSAFTGKNFIIKEHKIACRAMAFGLIRFLYETYGAIDIEKCRTDFKNSLLSYTAESIDKFIDDVFENYDDRSYYDSRKYLDSYLLLEMKPVLNEIFDKCEEEIDKMVEEDE